MWMMFRKDVREVPERSELEYVYGIDRYEVRYNKETMEYVVFEVPYESPVWSYHKTMDEAIAEVESLAAVDEACEFD